MTKCIAFHSYKGGTGKTTLACNCAAALTKKGYSVCLLDLDIYAPSFQIYFQREPSKGINDFLDSTATVEDVMVDLTSTIEDVTISAPGNNNYSSSTKSEHENIKKTGKLWIGFSNPLRKDVLKLEMADTNTKKEIIRRFIQLREKLMSKYNADYILLDTSPGMRFWSINTLAIADTLLLTLKSGDLDIEGTKRLVDEIYRTFTKSGSKAYLLCNRIAGYCVPGDFKPDSKALFSNSFSSPRGSASTNSQATVQLHEEQAGDTENNIDKLSSDLGIRTVSSIPCFCDIQFLRKEFLTVLKYPQHHFAKQIQQLIDTF
jgi:chromosome partitioning protein